MAPFSKRYDVMGTWAESAFEAWANENNYVFVKRGWDKPPFERFYNVHPIDRATPDYVVELEDRAVYVEVKGTIQDTVKIKEESIKALKPWSKLGQIYFFVWNSKEQTHFFLTFEEVCGIIELLPKQQFDNDKKFYWEVPLKEASSGIGSSKT